MSFQQRVHSGVFILIVKTYERIVRRCRSTLMWHLCSQGQGLYGAGPRFRCWIWLEASCVKCACCVGCLLVLTFPPTVSRHATGKYLNCSYLQLRVDGICICPVMDWYISWLCFICTGIVSTRPLQYHYWYCTKQVMKKDGGSCLLQVSVAWEPVWPAHDFSP